MTGERERAHLFEAAADLTLEDAHDVVVAERRDLPVALSATSDDSP